METRVIAELSGLWLSPQGVEAWSKVWFVIDLFTLCMSEPLPPLDREQAYQQNLNRITKAYTLFLLSTNHPKPTFSKYIHLDKVVTNAWMQKVF